MISDAEAFQAMDEMCSESERINAQLHRAMVIPMRRKSDSQHELHQHFVPRDSRRGYRPLLMLGIVSAVAVLGAVFIVIGGLG